MQCRRSRDGTSGASVMILLTRDDTSSSRPCSSRRYSRRSSLVGLVPGRRWFATTLRASWLGTEEIWLSLYYVAAAGFAYVDVMVAAALLSEQQLATLGASLRYLAIVQSPLPALGAILRVRTAQFDLVESIAGQRAMILTWLRRTVLPAALFAATILALAPLIIPKVDGGKYPESVEVLQIFLVMTFSAYVTAPAASILMAQRRYSLLFGVYAVGLLLNFVGDLAVASRFGIVGIAVVSSVVYVAIDLVLVGQALRYGRGVPANASLARPQPETRSTRRRAQTHEEALTSHVKYEKRITLPFGI